MAIGLMGKSVLAAAVLALLMPQSLRADAAPQNSWLHEGLVISGTWIAGQLNLNGRGTAASGVSQIQIVCIDGDKVIGVTHSFSDLRLMGLRDPVPLGNAAGVVVSLEQCGDVWLSPAKLAALPNDPAHGSTVAPISWKTPAGNVNCVEWVQQSPSSYTDHVFDAKTGLCYHFANRGIQGNNESGDFLSMRDVTVPWAHEAPPAWVPTLKALHYRGNSVSRAGPQLVNIPTQVTADMSVIDRGNGWLLFSDVTGVQVGQSLPIPGKNQMASGRCEIGGVWAGPTALAALKTGQVLDQDPITNVKTSVASVTNDSVIISCINASSERDFEYDKQSGILKSSSSIDGQLKQQTTLQLQSRE
jgi:hypothetical protein